MKGISGLIVLNMTEKELREELERVDAQIHALNMDRNFIVTRIRSLQKPAKWMVKTDKKAMFAAE